MKQHLIWGGAALACASVIGTQAQAAPATWSGFYVGVRAGGDWLSQHSPTTSAAFTSGVTNFPAVTIPFESHSGSWVGGGQLGYNFQRGPLVVGLEGDVVGHNLHGSVNSPTGTASPFIPADTISYESKWEAALRARLGYAWNNELIYVSGGLVFTDLRVSGVYPAVTSGGINFPASAGTDRKTLTGGTIGVGYEHKLGAHWSFGADYRYAWGQHSVFNLGTVAGAALTPTTFTNTTISSNTRLDHRHGVVVRVDYTF